MSGGSPKATLERHGLRAKKHFGQNFMTDAGIAERAAVLATTPHGGTVIEWGAGLGALTAPLLTRATRVIAVERDRDLVPLLEEGFADAVSQGRLIVLEQDAKSTDIRACFEGRPRPHVLAGNLPYQITGPLLSRAVGAARELDRAVFLVQLEVADRLTAAPGTAEYGALTVFVQAAFSTRRASIVRRGAFYPQPNVDSALVVFEPSEAPIEETPRFRSLVRAAFSQRRKTLRNAWQAVASGHEIEAAARRAGIDLGLRGEVLTAEAFAKMSEELDR